MNVDRAISKINFEMNAFNESGGREDKACAEGLRRAKTYIQIEVLKKKMLTENQQIVLEWLKDGSVRVSPFGSLYGVIREHELVIRQLSKMEQFQVLAAFAEWGMEQENKK